MSDFAMTVNAIEHFLRIAGMRVDTVDNLLVTADAVFLQHRGVAGLDHDRLVKILQCKPL